MSTRVISASTRYASEAARDAASGWDEGDVVYVDGIGYTVFDGDAWGSLGSGGGGSIVIGPFPISYTQEASLTGDGVVLASLAADTIVLRAWVEVGVMWDGAGSPGSSDYVLNIGVGSTLNGTVNVSQYNNLRTHEQTLLVGVVSEDQTGNQTVARTMAAGLSLVASLQNFSGALSAGTADIWALIVEAA